MRQKPRYVIYQGKLPMEIDFGKTVQQDYKLIKAFPKEINVYERIDRITENPKNKGAGIKDTDTSVR